MGKTRTNRKISAIIPTLNEEVNIQEAIASLDFADEIIIIDSHSTDKTTNLAHELGATVIHRKFDDFSSQKNFAIDQAKHDWIFLLDADERVTLPLKNEIIKTLQQKEKIADAYWIYRNNYFLNKKINFSGWQNDKVIRLFNRKKSRYNGNLVHEEIACKGEIKFLNNKLTHYTYLSFTHYKNKITQYAFLKAKAIYKKKKPNLFYYKLKVYYRFFYHYIIRLGFLDGKNGWIIASVNMYGANLIYKELKRLSLQ